jgi:hypothetical protein
VNTQNYQQDVDLAEHYLAIGHTRISIYTPYESKGEIFTEGIPWEYTSHVAEGGTWRNGMPVSVTFEADHPCGLTFSWSAQLEDDRSTGRSDMDLERIRKMFLLLPPEILEETRKLLLQNVVKCDEDVERWRTMYVERRDRARKFRLLVEGVVETE